MKHILTTILTFFISVVLFSQNLQITFYNSKDTNDKRSFYLDVVKNKAKFYADEDINKIRHLNQSFYDLKSNRSFIVVPKTENLNINENYLVHRDLPLKWEIKKESKIILGLTCFKATSSYFDLIAGEVVPLEIWYTTKLKNKIGPLGFLKTPGLILEIKSKFYSLTAKNININFQSEPISFPNYKYSTNIEIDNIVKKVFNISPDK